MAWERKMVPVLLALFLILTHTVYTYGMEVGTVINKVLSTDIKTFVNGYQIPSMNIDGHTVIVAEDLRNHGFDVVWNPGDRSLKITENLSKELKPIVTESNDGQKPGELIGDVLYTDIRTYIGDREVKSNNIGGYTTLLVRELEEWGSVIWDEEKREVRFVSDSLGNRAETENDDNFSFWIDKISETRMVLENNGDKFYYNGVEAGFYDGPAMLSLKILAEKFGYDFSYDYGYFTVKKGSYCFKIRPNDKNSQSFFDGKLFGERELWHEPVSKNNDLFVSDVDLSELFGLNKTWDIETNNISLNYPEYEVKDFGNHEILGEVFILKSAGAEPGIVMINRTSGNRDYSHGFYNRERSQFERESSLSLDYGDNEIDAAVVFKDRILLLKTFKDIRPDIKTHKLQNEKTIGPWTTVKIENPSAGYVETYTGQFEVKGKIASVNGDSLIADIDKFNEDVNGFEKLSPQSLAVKDNEFLGSINLESGYGIYRIKVYANITGLHGHMANTLAFEFFINHLR